MSFKEPIRRTGFLFKPDLFDLLVLSVLHGCHFLDNLHENHQIHLEETELKSRPFTSKVRTCRDSASAAQTNDFLPGYI